MPKTVKAIVRKYLKENGYDGLYVDVFDGPTCSCTLDDLMPCGQPMDDCKAGVFVECRGKNKDMEFCIGPKRK